MARPVLYPLDMAMTIDSRPHTIPLERMTTGDVLSCVEPFTAARPQEIEVLAQAAVRIRKPAGAPILEEGHTPDGLYIVLRGRVNLVRAGEGHRDLILMSVGPGDVLGETCAFDRTLNATAALAAVPVEVLRIPADVLAAHLRREPETMMRLMQLMTDKLRDIESVASSLALYDVEERLRRTLVRLAQRQGRRSSTAAGSSGWILAPVPTQSELARMVGSCRETVSRTLSAMARDGLVSSSGRRMILDPRLLEAAA
jgi:CRP/FNR family cyclic AMP-dependent transcriptional regulator